MSEEHQDLANVPVVYTNHVRMQMTLADFKLYFGEVIPIGMSSETQPTPPTPPTPPTLATKQRVVDRICIVISPDLIPNLMAGLAQGIQKYQEQFGPLRKPPQPSQPVPSTPSQKA